MHTPRLRLLVRHFVRGHFESDLVSPDEGLYRTLFPLLSAIAAPGLLLPVLWAFGYGYPYRTVAAFQALTMRHEVLLVMFPMTVVALVTALQWDALYPDRRDTEVLGRQPVGTVVVFVARLLALAIFAGVFLLAANAPATLLYPAVANLRHQPGAPGGFVTAMAHVAATFGGASFAGASVLAVLGVVQLCVPARLRRVVSPAVQLTLVLGLVLALLMLPFLMMAASGRGGTFSGQLAAFHWFPPFWYLGVYEVIAGRSTPMLDLLAGRAAMGLGVAGFVSGCCYVLAYRRHATGAMVGGGTPSALGERRRRFSGWLLRRLLPDPVVRAHATFTLVTLARSSKHRLMLGASVGAALAFILAEASVGLPTLDTARPSPQLLSALAVFVILLLAGMRLAFAVPSELRANWTFRVQGTDRVAPSAAGGRFAMTAVGFGPLVLLLTPLYVWAYGLQVALWHAAFVSLASLLLIEALLAGFPKVPCATAYVPGRAMVTSRLTLYLFVFQAFAYTSAWMESLLFRVPGGMAILCGVLAVPYAWTRHRRLLRERDAQLVFEEDPPGETQTLGLAGQPFKGAETSKPTTAG